VLQRSKFLVGLHYTEAAAPDIVVVADGIVTTIEVGDNV